MNRAYTSSTILDLMRSSNGFGLSHRNFSERPLAIERSSLTSVVSAVCADANTCDSARCPERRTAAPTRTRDRQTENAPDGGVWVGATPSRRERSSAAILDEGALRVRSGGGSRCPVLVVVCFGALGGGLRALRRRAAFR